jgi:siroheme synthase (precorrin-2 oxidase/ferrochelatase)
VILLDQPGFEEIDFTLPAAVDRGDLPIVITVGTATSRPTASAPQVKIN